ncbi:uncharacterized protein CTRU02_213012 [Colletotrichum truncatum]|uniref:Uncharacterized protein n=1 Tax=Colletotrichum truncatum TaxID=5467 RepID=A0ACC3YJI9_COLTU
MFRIFRHGASFLKSRTICYSTVLHKPNHHSALHNHSPLSADMDPFVANDQSTRLGVTIYQSEGDDVPEGLVSQRRLKFAKPLPPRLIKRRLTPPDPRERESTHFGWGQRGDTIFAKPATRNTLVEESRIPSQDHSFLGKGPESKAWGQPRVVRKPLLRPQQSVTLAPHRVNKPDASQPRQTASTGHLRSKHKRTQDCLPSGTALSHQPFSRVDSCRLFSGQSYSSSHSHDSEFTTSTIRRRHARDIFEEFGISRPSGWLSDDEEEDLSRNQDGTNSIPRHTNVCHSCRAEVTYEAFCATCGHSVCPQCAGEIPDEEDPPRTESMERTTMASEQQKFNRAEEYSPCLLHQEATESSESNQKAATALKNNPFIVADKITRIAVVEHQVTDSTVSERDPARFSDCIPKQIDLSASIGTHEGCRSSKFDDTHIGHHAGRHGISCLVSQHAAAKNTVDSRDVRSDSPLENPTQDKVDQLYHHAEDLQRAKHIMKYLAASSTVTEECSPDQVTESRRVPSAPAEEMLASADACKSHSKKLASFDAAIASKAKSIEIHRHSKWERSQSFDIDPVKRRGLDPASESPNMKLSSPPEWLNVKRKPDCAVQKPDVVEPTGIFQVKSPSESPMTREPLIEWPKLKKVTKETVVLAEKAPLPWMQRPLRRVQKGENVSQQISTQKSAEVDLWRSQLRRVSTLGPDSTENGHGKNSHYDHRKITEACISCRHDTPTPPPSPFSIEEIHVAAEAQEGVFANALELNSVEENRPLTSRDTSLRTPVNTQVKPESATCDSQTVGATRSVSNLDMDSDTSAGARRVVEEVIRDSSDAEVFSPMPIMISSHTCS